MLLRDEPIEIDVREIIALLSSVLGTISLLEWRGTRFVSGMVAIRESAPDLRVIKRRDVHCVVINTLIVERQSHCHLRFLQDTLLLSSFFLGGDKVAE